MRDKYIRKVYTLDNENFIFQNVYKSSAVRVGMHLHDANEIFLFLGGDAMYFVENNVYELKPYDIIITNSRELHTPIFKTSAPYKRVTLTVNPAFLSLFITDEFNPFKAFDQRKAGTHNKIEASTVKEHGLDKDLFEIENFLKADTPETTMLVKMKLSLMLHKIANLVTLSGKSLKTNEKLVEIIKYVKSNLSKDLSYKTIASALFINANYLPIFFKKQTGFTLRDYIEGNRVVMAKELILDETPLSRIPELTGFGDYSSFYRTFRKITKMSPKEFLKTFK